MAEEKIIKIEGREIKLSNLDKVLWPADKITKAEMIEYYTNIAPLLLPHLKNRPLVLNRFPDGIKTEGFFEKNAPEGTPSWVKTKKIHAESTGESVNYVVCEDLPTLVWLANLATIELHPWFSEISNLEKPNFAVIDLDPLSGPSKAEASGFDACAKVATEIKKHILDKRGLKGYLKTTGSRGIHIYIPIEPKYSYEEIRHWTAALAEEMAAFDKNIRAEGRVEKGSGVHIDWAQNAPGKTLASVYSLRPRDKATVSMPIDWSELGQVKPENFTIKNGAAEARRRNKYFAAVLKIKQKINL